MMSSVAASGDDEHFVSGSDNNTLWKWKREMGKCLQLLWGHLEWQDRWQFEVMANKLCVDLPKLRSISAGGRGGRCVWEPLWGLAHLVSSVAISSGGKYPVFGSDDKTLPISRQEKGKCLGGPWWAQTPWMSSAAISHEREHIFSGLFGNILPIWKGETGKYVGEHLWRYTDEVFSVATGNNYKHIVWDRGITRWGPGKERSE